ncbi:Bromo-adjacent-like (BAH) domain protein [Quillaja saponaria]|uniref:Bromo-adjacent-like (BAH) domain protein n=1 Tax=Quillaja saponaria TaxID=32244 RepID=A0AAD7PMD0_QUISA|nr:Bromo-adjacent-like (BAH) domain protein [Quillaja saponaria]
MCSSGNNIQSNNSFGTETKIQEKSQKGRESFTWPDDVVPAIAALEKASHLALSSDFHKYNQRLQKLLFNLKINPLLTQCLLNGELDPKKIFEMTPDELKKGLTSEEIVKETVKKELDESEGMQMVDVRCLHGI